MLIRLKQRRPLSTTSRSTQYLPAFRGGGNLRELSLKTTDESSGSLPETADESSGFTFTLQSVTAISTQIVADVNLCFSKTLELKHP
eukprot:m.2784 g.2784  ORF g.2784 m.2784 type:complete len:87 (-) comp1667_c0_seq1:372-632(-)